MEFGDDLPSSKLMVKENLYTLASRDKIILYM